MFRKSTLLRCVALTLPTIIAGITHAQPIQVPDELKAIVADGSESSIAELKQLARSGRAGAFEDASQALIKIAQGRFLNGDETRAHDIANFIWLSSAPHNTRVAAWKLMYLVEHNPRQLGAGHRVFIEAPGGRDHARFATWLKRELTSDSDWIIDSQISYELTLLSPNRAGETARIEFLLRSRDDESRLRHLIANSNNTYPTNEWRIIRRQPIGVLDRQLPAKRGSRPAAQ